MNSFFILLSLFSAYLNGNPDDSPKTVAIVEYRTGVSEQSDFLSRVTALMKEKTNLTIVTQTEARRRLGATLDADISNCKDNVQCFAKIGEKLKVNEIIVIGMTELGTVLISINRIIVKTGKVQGTADIDIPAGGRITKIQIFRLLNTLLPKDYFKRTGTLIVTSKITGATIKIAGKPAGETPAQPFKLPAPRSYAIEVLKDGYTSFKATVDLIPKSVMKLEAQLSLKAIAQKPDRWYQKWWVWAIASGVLITAGTTTYFLLQKPTSVPVEIQPYFMH